MNFVYHAAYNLCLFLVGIGLPFLFYTDKGAGFGGVVIFLLVSSLYVTDERTWGKRKKKTIKKEKPVQIEDSDDEDQQYRPAS